MRFPFPHFFGLDSLGPAEGRKRKKTAGRRRGVSDFVREAWVRKLNQEEPPKD
jgi:hypothetical protein